MLYYLCNKVVGRKYQNSSKHLVVFMKKSDYYINIKNEDGNRDSAFNEKKIL